MAKKFYKPDDFSDSQDEYSHRCKANGCPLVGTLSNDVVGDRKTFYCRFHFSGQASEWQIITRRLRELVADGMRTREDVLAVLYHRSGAETEAAYYVRTGKHDKSKPSQPSLYMPGHEPPQELL